MKLKVFSGLILISAALFAQDDSPLSATMETNGNVTQIKYRNVSAKVITGYVVGVYCGKSEKPTLIQNVMRPPAPSLGLDSRPNPMTSGATWSAPLRALERSDCRLAVDLVAFDDESVWGPDTLKYSLRMEGMRAGWQAALAQLRYVKDNQGEAAALTALTQTARAEEQHH